MNFFFKYIINMKMINSCQYLIFIICVARSKTYMKCHSSVGRTAYTHHHKCIIRLFVILIYIRLMNCANFVVCVCIKHMCVFYLRELIFSSIKSTAACVMCRLRASVCFINKNDLITDIYRIYFF